MERIDDVIKWGRDKEINNYQLQTCKVMEELGELCSELTRGRTNSDAVVDALGDVYVTIIILSDILGYDIRECLEVAWEQIKDRKGETIDGSFVKDNNS